MAEDTVQAIDYPAAVLMANEALGEILDQVQRASRQVAQESCRKVQAL